MDGTDLIDGILGEAGDEGTPVTENPAEPEGQVTEGDEAGATTTVEEGTTEKTDAEKLTEAEAKVTQLEGDVTALTEERDKLKSENDTLNGTVQDNASEITLLKEERDSFRDKNIALAKAAHRYLAERAVDLRVVLGEATREERNELITEYAKTPAKVLESTIKDLLEKPVPVASAPRESTKATSPGQVTDAAHTVGDGEVTESTSGNQKQEVNINDLAERMMKVLAK